MTCCPPPSVTSRRSPQKTICRPSIARDCATLVPLICPTRILSVFVCNSNAVIDDRWSLWLDGREIGSYDVGNEYRAAIILPLSAQGKTLNGLTGRGCTIFDFFYTSELDAPKARHRFAMRLEEKKGAGNFGSVQFLCTTVTDTDATLAATPAGNFSYGNPTPYDLGVVVPYNLAVSAA